MGSSETDKSTKEEPKTPASSQEQPSSINTGTVNPDWSGFQAYSHVPPPGGYIASSPQPHPYMWGVQHIMPSYGTPPPQYVAMYPPGGIYAHPSIPQGSYPFSPFPVTSASSIPEGSANMPGCVEVDGKPSEVKEKLPIKRSKGSLGSLNLLTGKNNELGKSAGVSANGTYSKSAESGSEGSSEGSDANSQNNSHPKSGECGQDSLEGNTSQNGNSVHCLQNGMTAVPGAPGAVSGPTTNLNIGMGYWGCPPTSSSIPTPAAGGIISAGSREGVQSHLWIQDERELKRQRRKQSNRESARRSRLRKQAECDELAQRAEVLKDENSTLRSELNHIRTQYEHLLSENSSLKEQLMEISGHKDADCGQNVEQ